MINNPWTIPFDGETYVCWKDNEEPKYRKLTNREEKDYFDSSNKEGYLHAILNS
jgi:hypothetical protein